MITSRESRSTSTASARRPTLGLSVHGKIDLCRGVLAWLVVLAHAFAIASKVHPTAVGSLTPSQSAILDHTVNTGLVWVMGFFVLSGYCIHQTVARRLSAPAFPLRLYLIARLSRILPLYHVARGFAVIAEPLIATTRVGISYQGLDTSALLAQLFLVQNLTHHYGSFTPSWSLTNEVFYYILYGLLAALMGRYRGRPFFLGMAICVLVGAGFQLLYLLGYDRSTLTIKTGMLFGLGFNWFLGVGVAVFLVEIRRSPVLQAVSRAWPIVLASAFAGYHWGLTIQFAYIVGGIAFALLLIRLVATPEPEGGIVEPPWASRFVRFAGLSSYPTYLFHYTFMWLIAAAILRWNLVGHWVTMMVILVAASLALGAVLGWYLERPIMQWRSSFLASLEKNEPSTRLDPLKHYGLAAAGSGKEPR